jgi:hypothetical protein
LVTYFQTRTPAIAARTTAAIVEMILQFRTRSPLSHLDARPGALPSTAATSGGLFWKVQSVTDPIARHNNRKRGKCAFEGENAAERANPEGNCFRTHHRSRLHQLWSHHIG